MANNFDSDGEPLKRIRREDVGKLTKAQMDLVRWERRLGRALTKVQELRKSVAYYRKKCGW